MTIETIITWLLSLWNALRGRSSSRVKLEVRSEEAIEDDREKLDKLYARIIGLDNEINTTIHEILVLKKKKGNDKEFDKDNSLELDLNSKREQLFKDLHTSRQEYVNASRCSN